VHFVEKVEDQKKRRSRMSEGSSNITMKLKYIIIIPIYSFTDQLHCDCFIRVTDCSIWGAHVPPLDPPLKIMQYRDFSYRLNPAARSYSPEKVQIGLK